MRACCYYRARPSPAVKGWRESAEYMRHPEVHFSVTVVRCRVEDYRIVRRRNEALIASPQVPVHEAWLSLMLRQDRSRLGGGEGRTFG